MSSIDQSGKISLHRAEDFIIPILREEADGTPIDMSSADIKFVADGAFEIVPTQLPGNPLGRQIHFTTEHAISLGKKTHQWAIIETTEGIPDVIASGVILAEGFAA